MDTPKDSSQQESNRKMTIILLLVGIVSLVVAFVIGINDNPTGILLMLAGCFMILFSFLHNVGETRGMKPTQQLVYWAPRTLGIVFTALVSLLAADVFNEGKGFVETSLDLIMHLIPTFLLIGVLIVSWRREWIGGILFILLGVLYVVWTWGRFPLATYFQMSGTLVVTGLLFLLSWRNRGILKNAPVP